MIDEVYLPLKLPEIEKYLPTNDGDPPLARADEWAWDTKRNKTVSTSLIKVVTLVPSHLIIILFQPISHAGLCA